ncbi:cobalt-precorrin-7 (C(5))-methyltransferase [Loigolactobacillus jiayinensis]|uniref:Cobalt-precorrin-7 (C(5))-methyltransferase n=1 Tax=Loigolactobacillus jiayinensis TaxID=2486016 RepID=A0ABW1RAL2_9LACO|nr:cobalt-precorrin-7 (C(5))-methyltransferase [Loigolactobacillus jiayinensis]
MINIVGIGPGDAKLMVAEVATVIAQAEVVVGSKRQLALFDLPAAKQYVLPKLSELKVFLQANQQRAIAVLASGDPLLYGIGNWALHQFPREQVHIVPGISAIQYCFHQIGLPMNDSYLTSSHGRVPDFDFLLQHETVAMVTDSEIGPYQIAQAVLSHQQKRLIYIGEMLSYPEEKITCVPAEQVQDRAYALNVVVITNA